ncbi:HAMP domain-containing sensor histidine kinase [soil metagenome]
MKLFTKYNRINLIATVAIFLLACISFFFLLRYIFIEQVDEDLEIEQKEILANAQKNNHLPEVIQLHDQQTSYEQVDHQLPQQKCIFKTISQYDKHEREGRLFRQIIFTIDVNGQPWLVTVRKSLEGTDDLVQSIILITICTILLILIATFFINRFVLRKLWQPFYNTLHTIKDFKLGDKQLLYFDKNNIDEFDLMNNTLEQAVNKAAQDYMVLKEFTENASHELQTPLAVIRSKLDLLIQDEQLSEQQSNAAAEAYEAINKLSKLNQSLLLLAKIENKQFGEAVQVNLKEKIAAKLKQFSELWQSKNIQVTSMLEDAFITINPELSDIMLNNLLSNAAKHNRQDGAISIHLNQGELLISNKGVAHALDTTQLFTRFYKEGAANENHGLGLSIVKQICEVSDCSITYAFDNAAIHVFIVNW